MYKLTNFAKGLVFITGASFSFFLVWCVTPSGLQLPEQEEQQVQITRELLDQYGISYSVGSDGVLRYNEDDFKVFAPELEKISATMQDGDENLARAWAAENDLQGIRWSGSATWTPADVVVIGENAESFLSEVVAANGGSYSEGEDYLTSLIAKD